nr:hypothetical protein [Phytohabitans houttuyneae]
MSIWTVGVPIGGTAQWWVVMPPVAVPTKQTRSARATTWLAHSREYEPTTPTDSGWVPGMVSLPLAEVATGMPSASASATSSAPARDARTPPPATMTGRRASASSRSTAATLCSSGAGRTGGTWAKAGSTSGSALACAVSSWPSLPWICRWTGPGAPVVATRNACRSMSGNRSASSIVPLNFVTGSKAGRSSISWYTCRNLVAGDRPPVSAITGEPARNGSRRPAARLSAPTTCAAAMPGRPLARA